MVTSSHKKKKPKLARGDVGLVEECRQQDVLMGRGKRISRWPGNIYFRQIVNKYRGDYVGSQRDGKFQVAHKVVQEVLRIGGRFLAVEDGGKFVEIGSSRALEKACQALREKEQSRPPTEYPFNSQLDLSPPPDQSPRKGSKKGESRMVTPSSTSKKMNLKSSGKATNGKASSILKRQKDKNTMVKSYEKDSRSTVETITSSDQNGIGLTERIHVTDAMNSDPGRNILIHEEKFADENEKAQAFPSFENCPLLFLKTLPNEVMLGKLANFQALYGHVVVPPNWPDNLMLADWCSMQRQLYRQVARGHRDATEEEAALLSKLSELNFAWDYESWHWDHQYEQLRSLMQQTKNESIKGWLLSSSSSIVEELDPEVAKIVEWFHDQRRQHQDGDQPLLSSRVRKFQQLGLQLTAID